MRKLKGSGHQIEEDLRKQARKKILLLARNLMQLRRDWATT